MSDLKFGNSPPKNGKSVILTAGHPAPTPYHVAIWVDGTLNRTEPFTSKTEAERFQTEEIKNRGQ